MPSSPNRPLAASAASTSSNTGGTTTTVAASARGARGAPRRSASGSPVTSRPSASSTSNRYSCTGCVRPRARCRAPGRGSSASAAAEARPPLPVEGDDLAVDHGGSRSPGRGRRRELGVGGGEVVAVTRPQTQARPSQIPIPRCRPTSSPPTPGPPLGGGARQPWRRRGGEHGTEVGGGGRRRIRVGDHGRPLALCRPSASVFIRGAATAISRPRPRCG